MGIFDRMLGDSESLFMDPVPLDYDFMPKLVPYREKEQQQIAVAIKPLFSNRNGKNILIHGPPGVGKTVAVRHVLNELGEKTDDIIPIYINTWQKNTTFKIVIELCDQLDYKFTHNKKTEELFNIVQKDLNKKSVVFCFDEIDKVEDLDFLYMLLEQIYRKTIIMITNYKSWAIEMDERIKSRLSLEFLEFRKYTPAEVTGILKERLRYAFVPDVWQPEAFNIAAEKTAEIGDIRTGLYILREAGNIAENRASRKIESKDTEEAIKKISEMKVKKTAELKDDEQAILDLIKNNSGKKIGDLFSIYKEKGGEGVYKTFQRKIEFLSRNKFISTEKQLGGTEGTTTIVKYERDAKLDEY
ncbi:TPA: AAA family ATPase [Candidatus Woesearchaeota archaeon]|nr:ORC1-type DNA replication protein [archaeon GW2011_AR15]MBS3104376.1 AAA family ATPase [Candidatus Woesearchaeota archaeon]HIH41311.1 AAA family ATPase [Candidatus Woesearchaeota archaeon]